MTVYCTCHGKPLRPISHCLLCGRRAEPLKGVYLERLYPGGTSCTGCGRRSAHCICRPVR